MQTAAEEVKGLTGGGLDYLINNAALVSHISSSKTLADLYVVLVSKMKSTQSRF